MKRTMRIGFPALLALTVVASGCGPSKTVPTPPPTEVKKEEPKKEEPKKEEFTVREVVVPEDPEFIEGVSQDAQKAFREGVLLVYEIPPNYDSAAEKFAEAIKLDSKFPEAYFNLGMVRQRQGRAADAIKVYQDALTAMPDNLDVKAYIGRVYLANAKVSAALGNTADRDRLMQQAREQFEKVTASAQDNVNANNGLALYWLMKGNLDTAEDFVKAVLTVEPVNVVALNTRGLINYQKGQYRIAQWLYEQKVLRLDDQSEDAKQIRESEASSEAWNNLGLTYIKLDMWPEAVRSFQSAVDVKPDNLEARMNLAAIYLAFLDYERALEQYQTVLEMQPDNLEAANGYGSALYGVGRFDEAIAKYREVLKIDPKRDELLMRIALIYEGRMNDLPKAIAAYEEYIVAKKLPETDGLVGKVKVLKQMQEQGGVKMPEEEGTEGTEGGTATPEEGAPADGETPAPAEGGEAAPAPAPVPEGGTEAPAGGDAAVQP